MSSIYRKGRDGYFYYQAYIRNNKTGKKDKRVFHALQTKNRVEAIKKQAKLDEKYKRKEVRFFTLIVKYHRSLLFFTFIGVLFYYTLDLIFLGKEQSYHVNLDGTFRNEVSVEPEVNISENIFISQNDNNVLKNDSLKEIDYKDVSEQKKSNLDIFNDSTLKTITETEKNLALPSYKIERFEEVSKAFGQIKIFATVKGNNSKNSLELLCKSLSKKYSSFSNILICLYTSDSIGKRLALGNSDKIGSKNIQEAWLAMYTFNSVEGEYFDENPTRYLSGY